MKPPVWAMALTAAGCVAALSLGAWQLRRADDKRALLADYLHAATAPAVALDPARPAPGRPQPVAVRGEYLPDRQLLLDNQASRERPGYHVWTPLRTAAGALVLVNRGWVPQFPRREAPAALPAPRGTVELHGLWRALPQAGLALPAPPCARAARFPHFVIYPQAAELACALGEPVAAGVLLLDPREPGGYVRDWHFSDAVPPERHVGYAVQWFAIALAILILFLTLNFKKKTSP